MSYFDQAVEDVARGLVAEAAEAAEVASREAAMWKERAQLQTNKIAQTEQKVRSRVFSAECRSTNYEMHTCTHKKEN